jgi:hypothetical protein
LVFFVIYAISDLNVNSGKYFLKICFKTKFANDKQVFGKHDLDDFLSQCQISRRIEDTRVEVEMLQNAL